MVFKWCFGISFILVFGFLIVILLSFNYRFEVVGKLFVKFGVCELFVNFRGGVG